MGNDSPGWREGFTPPIAASKPTPNFSGGCIWTGHGNSVFDRGFWFQGYQDETVRDCIWSTDRWLAKEPTRYSENVSTRAPADVHQRAHKLLAFPEQLLLASYCHGNGGSSGNVNGYIYRWNMTTRNSRSQVLELPWTNDSGESQSIRYWCANRIKAQIYSLESHLEFSGGDVISGFDRLMLLNITTGERRQLYEAQTFPEPHLWRRLYHPTFDYLSNKVILPQSTGSGFDARNTQYQILAIDPDTGNADTLVAIQAPLFELIEEGEESLFIAKARPIIAWTNGLSGKLYLDLPPEDSQFRNDSDVGLHQFDPTDPFADGERLCNSPREANFQFSESADFDTAFGPGCRANWEL